jgi:hypothetical protein
LLCRRLLDLVEVCGANGINLDEILTFTHVTHKLWSKEVVAVYEKLKSWEVLNNGVQTFSKAFDTLALKLKVKPAINNHHRRDSSNKNLQSDFSSKSLRRDEVLKDWLINLDHHNSSQEKIKLKRKKLVKVSATPTIPAATKILTESSRGRRQSPFNILESRMDKTTDLYQEYHLLNSNSIGFLAKTEPKSRSPQDNDETTASNTHITE